MGNDWCILDLLEAVAGPMRALASVAFGSALAGALGVACGSFPPAYGPDLVPQVPGGQPDIPAGFCQTGPVAVVTVVDQGQVDASDSTTVIRFGDGVEVHIPTPAISAGRKVQLPPVDVPGACFQPDCPFRVIVDFFNRVEELNEVNNEADGMCLASRAIPR